MELMTELLEAGVHFGHQTKRWNPKMKPFIFEQRNSIYIINLSETVKQLQVATDFLANVARQNGKVLFIGCKKQAQEAVKEAAVACGQFYVNQRWLGGTLDEPDNHSEKCRTIDLSRANRKIAGILEDGEAGTLGAAA